MKRTEQRRRRLRGRRTAQTETTTHVGSPHLYATARTPVLCSCGFTIVVLTVPGSARGRSNALRACSAASVAGVIEIHSNGIEDKFGTRGTWPQLEHQTDAVMASLMVAEQQHKAMNCTPTCVAAAVEQTTTLVQQECAVFYGDGSVPEVYVL